MAVVQRTGWALLTLQLRATLRRHWLDKVRHYRTTACECLLPVLIIYFLAVGYNLSEVVSRDAAIYVETTVKLPGALSVLGELLPPPRWDAELFCAGDSVCGDGSGRGAWSLINEAALRLAWEGNGTVGVAWENSTTVTGAFKRDSFNATCVADQIDEVDFTCETYAREAEEEGDGGVDIDLDELVSLVNALNDVLEGPLPIPTFDQFVNLGLLIRDNLDVEDYEKLINSNEYGRQFGNLFTLGELQLAPAGPMLNDFVAYMSAQHPTWSNTVHRVHADEKAALDYVMDHLDDRSWAIIHLDEMAPGNVDFTLRMNYTTLPNTHVIVEFASVGLSTLYQRYYFSGFLTLQKTLNEFAFASTLETSDCGAPNVVAAPMPTPDYNQNTFYLASGFLLGLAMAMATIYPVSKLLGNLVEEKESRMRETLLILGLREGVLHLGWLLMYTVFFTGIAVILTIIMVGSFTTRSEPSLIFAWVWLFLMSEMTLCFFLSTLFDKAKIASLCGPVAVFVAVLPRYIFFGTNRYEATRRKMLVSLLSPSAFTFGAEIVGDYEYAEIGVTYDNYTEGDYSFQTTLNLLFADTVLYGLLAFYLDKVLPREYGAPLPLTFFLHPSYWCPGWCGPQPAAAERQSLTAPGLDVDDEHGPQEALSTDFEAPPAHLRGMDRVQVRHLVKVYGGLSRSWEAWTRKACAGAADVVCSQWRRLTGPVAATSPRASAVKASAPASTMGRACAVDNLSLKMYEGQVTCLLGHNGAGKSTTIGVLTGLLPATSGQVSIFGTSITEDRIRGVQTVRQHMGVCPQHSVLYDDLTVREHLDLVAALKGIPIFAMSRPAAERYPRAAAITQAVEEVGLTEKIRTRARNLSGGMKRKLSVAMALLGDPAFVLLDEPTSGMDPYSRRSTWELLKRKKAGRVVLLTTHFMDEADILGDRVLIMSKGTLQCAGSPLFLKMRFGVGYNLSITCRPGAFGALARVKALLSEVAHASPFQEHGGELVFRIPTAEAQGFPTLFARLEAMKQESSDLAAFGLSITTLEEVFLRLAELEQQAAQDTGEAMAPKAPVAALEPKRRAILTPSAHSASLDYAFLYPPSETKDSDPGRDTVSTIQADSSEDLDSGDDASAATNLFLGTRSARDTPLSAQLKELLRKRITTARRDPQALFCQVLLPILLVGLALLILTVQPRLAGPSLKLNVGMFDDATLVEFAEGDAGKGDSLLSRVQESPAFQTNRKAVFERRPTLNDSVALSDYFLETYNTVGRRQRYGAYVFGDRFRVDVDVDWLPVREGLPEALEYALFYLVDSGELEQPIDLGRGSVRLNGPDVVRLLTETITDGTYALNCANVTVANGAVSAVVDTGGEPVEVSLTPASVTVDGVRGDLTDGFFSIEASTALGGDGQFLGASLNTSLADGANAGGALAFLGLDGDGVADALGLNASTLTVGDILDAINTTRLSATPGTVTLELSGASVFVDLASFSWGAPVFFLEGLALRFGAAATIQIPVQTLSVPQLQQALPNTTQSSSFRIPWDHTLLHNASAWHALPAFYNQLADLQYQECLMDEGRGAEYRGFSARNHPLPLTAQQSLEIQTVLSIFAALFIQIPMCYAPAAFVLQLVREAASKAKHLQLVSGVSPHGYWLATYAYDSVMWLIITAGTMFCFFLYGADSAEAFFASADARGAVFLVVLLYGLSVLPLNYIYSRYFQTPSTAQISIVTLNFITGFVALLSLQIMLAIDSTRDFAGEAVHVFRFFPSFLLGEAFIAIAVNYFRRVILDDGGPVWDYEVAGRPLMFLAAETVGYLCLLLLLESDRISAMGGVLSRCYVRCIERMLRSSGINDGHDDEGEVDEDVAAEGRRVATTSPDAYSVYLRGLRKSYPGPLSAVLRAPLAAACCSQAPAAPLVKRAVRRVDLGVEKGEIFGLLGINGAGKTTTLSVLTNDATRTSGEAFVCGFDVGEWGEVRKRVGYCPQVDPIFDLLTARETLHFYGRIKGVDAAELTAAVDAILELLGLDPYADMVSRSYSGGNKRKLSLGVALVGDPEVLFLDEPSTGMDPGARRSMWGCIEALSRRRQIAIVLTTHSMEECEALCTRIGIMVGGTFRCLGSATHLKQRFLDAHEAEFRVREGAVETFEAFLSRELPEAKVLEAHGLHYRVGIPRASRSLAAVFAAAEKGKVEGGIQEYSVTQGRLEQVFMGFAKQQREERGQIDGVVYDE